jgi:asparagine synthase (glutamine-hydrolysing)
MNHERKGMYMCAIAGMVNLPIPDTKNMLSTMARRGPDGQGVFTEGPCCLLHSRLAIIDPEGGKQPMTAQIGSKR